MNAIFRIALSALITDLENKGMLDKTLEAKYVNKLNERFTGGARGASASTRKRTSPAEEAEASR